MQFSVPHDGIQARPGSSGHLIEPIMDVPSTWLPTDHHASNEAPGVVPVSFLEGASNLTINNSTLNNIGRDATFINNYDSVMHLSLAMLHYFH